LPTPAILEKIAAVAKLLQEAGHLNLRLVGTSKQAIDMMLETFV